MLRFLPVALLAATAFTMLALTAHRAPAADEAPAVRNLIFAVKGVTCELCSHAVKAAATSVDGVTSVTVHPTAGRAVVNASLSTSPEAIAAAITGKLTHERTPLKDNADGSTINAHLPGVRHCHGGSDADRSVHVLLRVPVVPRGLEAECW